jgi:hypothetical protein
MSLTLIETKTLGADAASIEFTSIPQDGTDLVALVSARIERSGSSADEIDIAFNSSTSDFAVRRLRGNGSTVATTTGTRGIGDFPATTSTANTFGNGYLYIPNYSGATNKSFSADSVSENNATTAFQYITAGLWSNTSAITSITFTPQNGTAIVAGSIISLYKVVKGTDGIVTTS